MNFKDLEDIIEKKTLSPDGAKRLQPFIVFFAKIKSYQQYFENILNSFDDTEKSNLPLAQKILATCHAYENKDGENITKEFFTNSAIRSAKKYVQKNVENQISFAPEIGLSTESILFENDIWYKKLPITLQETYKKFLKICELRFTIKGLGSDIRQRAYNVTVFFENIENVDKYLSASTPGKPSHTFLSFELPDSNNWNKKFWRNMAMEHGYDVTQYLHLAPQLEIIFQYEKISTEKNIEFPTLERIVHKLSYKNGEDHPEVSKLGIQLGLNQAQFDRTIEELRRASKEDSTPEININGEDIGCPGYRLEKTPKDSPLNLWIGGFPKINNCCKIGNVSGITSGNNTIGEGLALAQSHFNWLSQYVILSQRNNPVAKITGWIQDDNFVLNSWQSALHKYEKLQMPFIHEIVQQIFINNPNIKKIYLGVGKSGHSSDGKKIGGIKKNNLKKFGFPTEITPHPIKMKDPYYDDDLDLCQYDCEQQILLASR